MFAEPQSVTIGASTSSLARTGMGVGVGQFISADNNLRLDVSHSQGRRHRRVVRLTSNKISADPLVPSQNARSSASVYMVVDAPLNGYSVAEVTDLVKGFVAYLQSGTYTPVSKLVAGEA